MKLFVTENEINERIRLNFLHLKNDPYYSIDEVFSPDTYSWYGDKEGRALLAFVSHYSISGEKIPCMAQMMKEMPERLNSEGYFGPLYNGTVHEEQLSGHSWLLRGLCGHYKAFGDDFSYKTLCRITENLYLPLKGKIHTYPINRDKTLTGGVSGEMTEKIDRWHLSSDIGCAFMSIDGLSDAYEITRDSRIKEILDEMIGFYLSIDKIALKAQTHCTLTSARGMLRLYKNTLDGRYLKGAEEILGLYASKGGMTKTYQNLNWWGREDSWTEPCAIIDSLMVASELYKITQKEEYRVLAARIYHNGLATAGRDNGGAGTDTLICEGSPHKTLRPLMYEAPFCCTMRMAEGLRYINENRELLTAEMTGIITKGKDNIYRDGDIIYCLPCKTLIPFAENGKKADGMILYPIVKAYKVPREIFVKSEQKILFD